MSLSIRAMTGGSEGGIYLSESCKSLLTAFSLLTGLFLSTQSLFVGFLSFFMRGKIKRGKQKRKRNSGRKEEGRGAEKETKEEKEGEEQVGIRGKTMILCLCPGKSHSKVSLPWLPSCDYSPWENLCESGHSVAGN